jgi:cell wall-associated NlpC family hydrolase
VAKAEHSADLPAPPASPERHLDVDFWIARADGPSDLVMDAGEIERFNRLGFAQDPNLCDLTALPASTSAAETEARIRAMSRRHKLPLYFHAGGPVEDSDYEHFEASLALDQLADPVPIQFGMVLQRTDMRTWPSEQTAYKNPETIDLDRFQENGLFPGDAVAILHESRDGQWCFAQSYNYAAWVRKAHIAPASHEAVTTYREARPFLVVTGGKVRTNYNPRCEAVSELQLDMGVRLPLVESHPGAVDGQNASASHTVLLPVRSPSGEVDFYPALVARSQDVRIDYLPYTRANLLRQGFKFLGERYGWGHSYNARDCSGLVTDIYRSMGILLPRNTLQQVESPMGQTLRFSGSDGHRQRLAALDDLRPGDLVYSPGHVMIYVGHDNGRPYVLHDTSSPIRFERDDGGFFEGILNGVSITPFISLTDENGDLYLDTLWAIKKIH